MYAEDARAVSPQQFGPAGQQFIGNLGGGYATEPGPRREVTLQEVGQMLGGNLECVGNATVRARRIADLLVGSEPEPKQAGAVPSGSLVGGLHSLAQGQFEALNELHRTLSRIESALGL